MIKQPHELGEVNISDRCITLNYQAVFIILNQSVGQSKQMVSSEAFVFDQSYLIESFQLTLSVDAAEKFALPVMTSGLSVRASMIIY